MNNFKLNHKATLKLTSLVYFINLTFSQTGYASNQMNQKNHQLKSPCSIRSNACINLASNNNQNKDRHVLNPPHSTVTAAAATAAAGKLRPATSGYIQENHHYRLTPIDFEDKNTVDKIDVYQPKQYGRREINNASRQENFKLNKEHSSHYGDRTMVVDEHTMMHQNATSLPMAEALHKPIFTLPDSPSLNQSFFLNATSSLPLKRANKHLMEDIYGELSGKESKEAKEKIEQINAWLTESSSQIDVRAQVPKQLASHDQNHLSATRSRKTTDSFSHHKDKNLLSLDKNEETMKTSETKLQLQSDYSDYEDNSNEEQSHSSSNKVVEKKPSNSNSKPLTSSSNYNVANGLSGTTKTPPCATAGRFYCSYKEDYPESIVAEITKYYKWPLEKLFRDLRQQVMPKLGNDNYGALVCDSVTRVVRPGCARNTANKWLVVINTEEYQQYVTEILCREPNARCNFIPPCYQATCRQRFNTQKLLVIDPFNRFKGPFLSEFLFPSCCVCYIPEAQTNEYSIHALASNSRSSYSRKTDEMPSNVKLEF